MKPMGPIPPEFAGQAVLTVGGLDAEVLLKRAGGTPVFVYDLKGVTARVQRFREAFGPQMALHYAIKANPMPALIEKIAPLVDGLDVASAGELGNAREAMAADRISFAGPGKRDVELELAIREGVTINLESDGEATRAFAIGHRIGFTPRLAVRVNPDFELRGSGMRMGGRASPFGIDAGEAAALVRRILNEGAAWRGFHIFAGSQALDSDAIIETQAQTLTLAGRLADKAGASPPLLNLGGGFGIPYFANDLPVDIERIGEALAHALIKRPDSLNDSRFAIELGRWLVGESGVYLTRVVDRKTSQGEVFVVVDGGLHHQLAASGNFGTVVRRNYPIAVAHRMADAPEETVSVVGCLCTPLDRLADKVALPRAEVGDAIAIFLAGAYGRTASPEAFLGHPPPHELLIIPEDQP